MKINFPMPLFGVMFFSTLLFSQNDESWKVYDDSEVTIIQITVNPNDLEYMYDNPNSDSTHIAAVHFKNVYIDEVVDSVGIRLRGATSRLTCKKSFKLSFNEFLKGRKFYSIEKMNLNGEHNDPSLLRSKFSFDLYKDMNMISSRAAFVALYINEDYYGLYLSVEHIDEEFVKKNFSNASGNLWKCLHPANLEYIGHDAELYKYESNEGRSYDLKTNTSADDYSKLAELIDVINNSSEEDFFYSLSQIISIEDLLKHYSLDIMTGNWDDLWFGWNNYYLYFNPDENKFRLIPYDYDNSFGIVWDDTDWATRNIYNFGNINQPLILNERILQNSEMRNLLTHFLDFYSNRVFKLNLWENRADQIKNLITPFVELEAINCEYFSNQTFHQSYDSSGFSYNNGLIISRSLKDFVKDRYSSLREQLEYTSSAPSIYKIQVDKSTFYDEDSILVNASVFSPFSLTNVYLSIESENGFETYSMNSNLDGISRNIDEYDRWNVRIKPRNDWKRAKISVFAEDNYNNITVYPKDGIEINRISKSNGILFISEVMSTNYSLISDEAGDYDDWLEIYNSKDTVIDLSGKFLSDKKDNLTKWSFPEGIKIEAKGHILLWCDEDMEQSKFHTNFKINSNGEFIALTDSDRVTIIDSVTIPALNENESYSRETNIDDWFITSSSTPGVSNIITSLSDKLIPKYSYKLEAFPNPFNPSTNIEYEIASPMNVELKIYDILGREVWSTGKIKKEAGIHQLQWNGKDYSSNEISSGIYLLNINGESYNKTIKLMLVR